MPDRLATAQWEDPSAVATKYPYDSTKFWLGRTAELMPIGYADDRHICLVSGTRGGKGTSIIINNLCCWPGSAVVIDPKGENATVTAARRGRGDQYCTGLGQAVHVLDPFDAVIVDEAYRSCFNPLDVLNPAREETIDEASRLANAIVVVKDEKADSSWDESARSMVRALILHVVTSPDFLSSERTLTMVRELLKRGDWMTYKAMEEDGQTEIDPPHVLLWRSVEMNAAFGGLVAGDGSSFLSILVAAPKQYQGVLQAALLHTEFLDSLGMRRVLARSDFKLSELKTRPAGMTLYLSLPQRHMDTHYRWLRMMATLITTQMEITRGVPATGHPVLMILDEFAGLKRMTAIENAVAQIAGFGVKLMFVLQSLEQLKAIYKDSWETFLSNAGLKLFFSIEDNFTREYVSKQVGETELVRVVRSENTGSSTSESQATGRSASTGTSSSQGGSRSQAHGTSSSAAHGGSASVAHGRNQSDTFGDSETFSLGWNAGVNRSRATGRNWSSSHSSSHGGSSGTNWSSGSSSNVSFGQGGVSSSFGRSSSVGGSEGSNWSETDTESEGGSITDSFGRSYGVSGTESTGRTTSRSDGSSVTGTQGVSFTQTEGSSATRTDSTSWTYGGNASRSVSDTNTRGTGSSQGQGVAETVHRRPLVRPEEIGQLFARIDDPADPLYPGLALVLVAGRLPLMVRRSHYFLDPQFIDCFSRHPDHKFIAATPYLLDGARPLLDALEAENGGQALPITGWYVDWNVVVRAGQPLVEIGGIPYDRRKVTLHTPVTGKVVGFDKYSLSTKRHHIGAAPLLTIKHYGAATEAIDPLAELRAACAAALAHRLAAQRKLAKEIAAREQAVQEAARQAQEEAERERRQRQLVIAIVVVSAMLLLGSGLLIWHFWEPIAGFFAWLWQIIIMITKFVLSLLVVAALGGVVWLGYRLYRWINEEWG